MELVCDDLKKLDIFKNLSGNTIKRIFQKSETEEYSAGEILFHDKEKVNTIYFILSGTASLYKMNENGQKKVIFILDKGKVINEVIIKDLPASINCEIFEKAEILSISRHDLLEIMKDDFDLCQNIIISLSMKTRRMYRQLKNTPPSIKLEKKLAAKIYKLGKDYGTPCDDGICVNMDMTITYIADLLGSQRETVSRAIKVLQGKGLIKYKSKKIFIADLESLADFFKTL